MSWRAGEIEYTLKGNGPVILVLHGMSQDCHADSGYDAFIDAGLSILTPSRPGYGKTPASTGPTAEKAAGAMAQLMDDLGVRSAGVMAVSGGGPTALYFAAKYPGRVRRLALVSALSRPWQDKARYDQVRRFYGSSYKVMWSMLRISSTLFPRMTAKRTFSLFSTHDANDFMKHASKEDISSLLRLFKTKAYPAGPPIDLGSLPEASVLAAIKCLTLVVHSKEDRSVDFGNAEYSAKNIRLAELFVSPTWSHFPWIGPGGKDELDKVVQFFKMG